MLLILPPVFFTEGPVDAGSSFAGLSATTAVIKLKNTDEKKRIEQQVEEARQSSQKILSKEELARLKEQAEQAIKDQAALVQEAGSTVFVGSMMVE